MVLNPLRRLWPAVRPWLPIAIQRWIRLHYAARHVSPALGAVDIGDLDRTTPISRDYGYDRGRPVDRYYIETFLAAHSGYVAGNVLEIGDNYYTTVFGADNVESSDVLHIHKGNPKATMVGDLAQSKDLPMAAFDCILCTQTLQLIYDIRSAVASLHRMLRSGGVALVTVPGITQLSEDEWGASWHWRFTENSARMLFQEAFGPDNVQIIVYGNVLAAITFLHGLSTEEVGEEKLAPRDPLYDVLIGICARK